MKDTISLLADRRPNVNIIFKVRTHYKVLERSEATLIESQQSPSRWLDFWSITMTDSNTPETEIKRWTAARRIELILQILRRQTTAFKAAREYHLKQSDIERRQKNSLNAGENALRHNTRDELERKQKEIDELYKKVGKLTLQDKTHRTVYKNLGIDPFASKDSVSFPVF